MPRLGLGLGHGRRRPFDGGGIVIPSLPVEWWRSDLGITLNGSNVSSWLGQKVGYNLAQGTAADQPAYAATDAAYNNQPSITGDGSSDWLTEAAGAGTLGALIGRGDDTPFTLIATLKRLSTGAASNVVGWAKSTDASNYKMRVTTPTGAGFNVFRRTTGSVTTTDAGTLTTACVLSVVFSGTAVSTWVSNTIVHNAQALDTATMGTNPDRLALFTDPDSVPGAFGNFSIAELRVYTSELSTGDRQSEQVSMAAYAGITLS